MYQRQGKTTTHVATRTDPEKKCRQQNREQLTASRATVYKDLKVLYLALRQHNAAQVLPRPVAMPPEPQNSSTPVSRPAVSTYRTQVASVNNRTAVKQKYSARSTSRTSSSTATAGSASTGGEVLLEVLSSAYKQKRAKSTTAQGSNAAGKKQSSAKPSKYSKPQRNSFASNAKLKYFKRSTAIII